MKIKRNELYKIKIGLIAFYARQTRKNATTQLTQDSRILKNTADCDGPMRYCFGPFRHRVKQ